MNVLLNFSVYFFSVSYVINSYNIFFSICQIDNPVITNSNSINFVCAMKLTGMDWERIFCKGFYIIDNSGNDFFDRGIINLFQQISSNKFYRIPFFLNFSLILSKVIVGSSRLSAITERS